MADFIAFTEGKTDLANNGLPATCFFDLSTRDCNTHVAGDTFAGGYGIITGTGYAAQSQAEPAAAAAAVTFVQMSWATGSATDWPVSVKSCVLRTASKIICAWNLQSGGTARNLSGANTTEQFSPTLTLS